ncbi:hypothetical protein SADUNF_Sadunf04G0083700 [Salix dunnii]|uniref:Uncharacterized protein n=1 Tax=Salix dunnii TaxID=1413687 RepID=A0A835N0P2_9ROSI|nr:hypothetical protein SADUNF_Sadunf04G0083700 [Salix dunnii]
MNGSSERYLSKIECPAGPIPKHECSAEHLMKRPCSAEQECPAVPQSKYAIRLYDCPTRCPHVLMFHKVPTPARRLPSQSTDFDLPYSVFNNNNYWECEWKCNFGWLVQIVNF